MGTGYLAAVVRIEPARARFSFNSEIKDLSIEEAAAGHLVLWSRCIRVTFDGTSSFRGHISVCVTTLHLPGKLCVLGVAHFELLPIVGPITVVLIVARAIKDKLLLLLHVLGKSRL